MHVVATEAGVLGDKLPVRAVPVVCADCAAGGHEAKLSRGVGRAWPAGHNDAPAHVSLDTVRRVIVAAVVAARLVAEDGPSAWAGHRILNGGIRDHQTTLNETAKGSALHPLIVVEFNLHVEVAHQQGTVLHRSPDAIPHNAVVVVDRWKRRGESIGISSRIGDMETVVLPNLQTEQIP